MTAKNLSINPLLALFQNRARFLEKIATRAGSRLLEDNPAKLVNLQPSTCNVGVHRPGRKEFPNG